MTKVSAVMCTRNRADLIARAVGSVLANDHPEFDLLVVDQSTDDSTERALATYMADARFRYLHVTRPGLSAAYNRGIRETDGPLIAFTDDDCVAPVDWLRTIETAFQGHLDVDLLYGQTLAAPEMANEPGYIPDLKFQKDEILGKGHKFRVYGMGANFAMRRRLFQLIGCFDEALGGGGPLRSSQDFDYQYRAYKAGALTLLCSSVWVSHYGIREGKAWTDTLAAYGAGDGAFYFKHVRCGDWQAMALLARILVKGTVKELLNPIRRRRSNSIYLRACLTGIRNSMKFGVDRKLRLYKFMENIPA